MARIIIENVSVIFGAKQKAALNAADHDYSRSEIESETGAILGVHNCSLRVEEGEALVLMGLSGSGKSTLLRTINGLIKPARGLVSIEHNQRTFDVGCAGGRELQYLRTHLVSMVFQAFGLLPWRTVAENVALGLEIARIPRAKRRAIVMEQLELVSLADWADRPVGALSGGMQQRVGLARAFATGAPVLLMDEPFSALDPLIRKHLQDELLELQRRLNKTIVFVSHDLDEAIRMGNRIAIMRDGRIVQYGTPQEIMLSPADDHVSEFVRNINPLKILTARDIMRPFTKEDGECKVSAMAKAQTPVAELVRALDRTPGEIGIVENGSIVGVISTEDIISRLAQHERRR